jgi:hypothetical protein
MVIGPADLVLLLAEDKSKIGELNEPHMVDRTDSWGDGYACKGGMHVFNYNYSSYWML